MNIGIFAVLVSLLLGGVAWVMSYAERRADRIEREARGFRQ